MGGEQIFGLFLVQIQVPVPQHPGRAAPCDRPVPEGLLPAENNSNRPRRSGWRPWAELLKRSFDIQLRCAHCNATMTLKSFVSSRASLQRLLTRLGEPTEVQGKAPARGVRVHMQRRELARLRKELEDFVTATTEGMSRSQRREALGHYITGLLLEGERKSIAPIAERIAEASAVSAR
jgi:hypothetical protein